MRTIPTLLKAIAAAVCCVAILASFSYGFERLLSWADSRWDEGALFVLLAIVQLAMLSGLTFLFWDFFRLRAAFHAIDGNEESEESGEFEELERSLAYEMASGIIEGNCERVHTDSTELWYNLASATGGDDQPIDLSEEAGYLESRRLLRRHPENAQWVSICDEGEPLPEDTCGDVYTNASLRMEGNVPLRRVCVREAGHDPNEHRDAVGNRWDAAGNYLACGWFEKSETERA